MRGVACGVNVHAHRVSFPFLLGNPVGKVCVESLGVHYSHLSSPSEKSVLEGDQGVAVDVLPDESVSFVDVCEVVVKMIEGVSKKSSGYFW